MNIQTSNSAGTLDFDFGANGVAMITVPPYPSASIHGVEIGPDKKIYFVAAQPVPFPTQYILGRLLSDGKVDTDFGKSGFVVGNFPGFALSTNGVQSLTIQPDGKIIVHCIVKGSAGQNAAAFCRYDAQGQPDTDFGTNGQTVLDIILSPPAVAPSTVKPQSFEGNAATPLSVEVLPNGKLLASHYYSFDWQQSHGLIIRLNENGTLDTDFNQIGYIAVIHPRYLLGNTVLLNLMVRADGKYLGCGNVGELSDPFSSAMFVRYDTSGKLDKTFGEGGFVTIASDAHSLLIRSMVLQPNQHILGVGYTTGEPAVLISIKANGEPDGEFNGGKPLFTKLEESAFTTWLVGRIQADGKAVVAGGVRNGNEGYIVIARFIDEQFDPSFNYPHGWVRTELGSGLHVATGLTLQEDGKILICARLPDGKIGLLRYHA